ncbi:MAG: V-type ATP synthase subunit I [Actinobacteria bacterium]|nr:V-type ATP synthase subunit I [Actinomycetota bacterium]
MPIARMSKVSILAPLDQREELVDRLQHLGAVHINDFATAAAQDDELKHFHHHFEPDTRPTRLSIAKTEFILELFERFDEAKGGLVSGLLKGQVHLTLEEYLQVEEEFDLETVYRELEEMDVEHRHAEAAISELEEDIETMLPWREMDCPLGEVAELGSTRLRAVIVNDGVLAEWEAEMDQRCPHAYWEEVGRERESVYVAVMVHVGDLAEFDLLASERGLDQVQLENGKTGTVEGEIASARERLSEQRERKKDLEEGIRENFSRKPQVLALNDFYHNQLAKEEAKRSLLHTERAVVLEGWLEESRQEDVLDSMKWLGKSVDVDFSPPGEEEKAPTLLVNRRRIRPAETLIELFGLPNRAETDPTPFVAPFFILFFGMCIGDVGYGLILAGAFWLALRKLDVSDNVRRFLRVFMYCGIASIVVGIFTRGYFGIDGYLAVDDKALPAFMRFPGTMDILKEPKPFMLICLALGLIHISIGVAIEMYDNIRHNSVWLGICEQGTTLLFWFGIAVAAFGYGIGLEPVGLVGVLVAGAGIAGVIFLSNITSKSIPGKFFGGLYNFYGLFASTIGDVASYLRLYALGLATIAIGMVVNIMASLVWGIPVLGIIALLAILLGGHIFNLAVSFLSAFVHPLRLQYVEFFSKFYEDGGEPFSPLAIETRKTVIDKE